MNLQDFINTYNLKDITIIKSQNLNNSYLLYLSFEFDFPMIANGCRPEFDYDVTHLFEFSNQDNIDITCNEIQYIEDYQIIGDSLKIKTNKQTITIKPCEIFIKSNIKLQEFYL